MCGCTTKRPTALGTLTRTTPSASWVNWPLTSITERAALTISLQRLNTSSPPSLKRNLRVVRCNNRVARAFSRREMLRLTAEGEEPSWRAASEKLPVSTTLTKMAISASKGRGRFMLMTQ